MGNCFAACSQRKRSVTKLTPENRGARTSRFSNVLLKHGGTPPKNFQTDKRFSARIPKIWSRRKNQVSPCNSGSVGNAKNTGTFQESKNRSSSANQSSDNAEWSESSEEGTSNSNSSNEDFLSDSYQSVSDNDKSRTPSPIIQLTGVTKGRLIIVQPCKSISSSFVEVASTTELPRLERSSKTPSKTGTEREIEQVHISKDESLEICSSTSSFGSWTDVPQNIELDQMSEDESCQVFPYISGMHT